MADSVTIIDNGPSNAVVAWDPNSGAALPAYLSNALDDLGGNIADRMNVPSLSYEGKTWTIVKDGNKQKLQSRNSDGDLVPIPVMRMVVLAFNDSRGRAYYPGVYNPAASAAPTCWSPDGVKPDDSVKEKQHSVCQGCPMSIKGSKVQDGKEMVACGSHRMIAIAPATDIEMDPLRLKIAVTSDYDKEIAEHGWFAFRQYADWLKSRGISHTALVVTKVKFDSNVAYPKLLFALDRPLSEAEVASVKKALKNPKVTELLAEKWSAAGANGTPTDDKDIKPHGLEGAYADGWIAHPDSAGWSYKGSEVISNEDLAARYPAPAPKPEPIAADPVVPALPASEMVIEVPQVATATTAHIPTAPGPQPAAEAAPTHVPWIPLVEAEKAGWIKHPTAPDYHYKGEQVVLSTDVAAMFPAPQALVAPEAPPAPPAPPPAPVVAVDPIVTAEADGWIKHPTAPDYHYKGEQVVLTVDVAKQYAGNASATAAAAPATGAPAAATSSASPTSAEIPADVANLLDKWTA